MKHMSDLEILDILLSRGTEDHRIRQDIARAKTDAAFLFKIQEELPEAVPLEEMPSSLIEKKIHERIDEVFVDSDPEIMEKYEVSKVEGDKITLSEKNTKEEPVNNIKLFELKKENIEDLRRQIDANAEMEEELEEISKRAGEQMAGIKKSLQKLKQAKEIASEINGLMSELSGIPGVKKISSASNADLEYEEPPQAADHISV